MCRSTFIRTRITAAGESKDSPAVSQTDLHTAIPASPADTADSSNRRQTGQPHQHINTHVAPTRAPWGRVENRQNKGRIPQVDPPFVFQEVVYSTALHCSDPEIPVIEAGKDDICCCIAAAADKESSLPSASTSCTMV